VRGAFDPSQCKDQEKINRNLAFNKLYLLNDGTNNYILGDSVDVKKIK
jgi:hypothetical protein